MTTDEGASELDAKLDSDLYYMQDTRNYCGNDMMFWAEGGSYTTDVSKARLFTKAKAEAQHKSRASDLPWPRWYIDSKTRPAVDFQYVDYKEAMRGESNAEDVRREASAPAQS